MIHRNQLRIVINCALLSLAHSLEGICPKRRTKRQPKRGHHCHPISTLLSLRLLSDERYSIAVKRLAFWQNIFNGRKQHSLYVDLSQLNGRLVQPSSRLDGRPVSTDDLSQRTTCLESTGQTVELSGPRCEHYGHRFKHTTVVPIEYPVLRAIMEVENTSMVRSDTG